MRVYIGRRIGKHWLVGGRVPVPVPSFHRNQTPFSRSFAIGFYGVFAVLALVLARNC